MVAFFSVFILFSIFKTIFKYRIITSTLSGATKTESIGNIGNMYIYNDNKNTRSNRKISFNYVNDPLRID